MCQSLVAENHNYAQCIHHNESCIRCGFEGNYIFKCIRLFSTSVCMFCGISHALIRRNSKIQLQNIFTSSDPAVNYELCCYHLYAVPNCVSGVMLSLTSANGGAAINVTWDAPVDDVVIAHYEVMYVVSEHLSAGGTGTSTVTIHIITGLEKVALYRVQVRAVSMEGGHAGAYSAVQSITAPVGEK